MKPPRKNRISGQWSPRPIEMLESPAYRTLSLSAHRVISRIEIELARHGGHDNGGTGIHSEYGPDYYAAFLIEPRLPHRSLSCSRFIMP